MELRRDELDEQTDDGGLLGMEAAADGGAGADGRVGVEDGLRIVVVVFVRVVTICCCCCDFFCLHR